MRSTSKIVNLGQGTELLARHGVRVPLGIACQTLEQINAAALKLRSDDGDVVLKSQASQQVPLQHVCPHLSRSMYAKLTLSLIHI